MAGYESAIHRIFKPDRQSGYGFINFFKILGKNNVDGFIIFFLGVYLGLSWIIQI